MTKEDIGLIKLGLILLILTILFPPWKMDVALAGGTICQSLNYQFSPIFIPPEGSQRGQMITGYTIDIPRLLMLWTAIVSVCGYFILIPRLMKSKNINEETVKEE